MTLCHIEGCEDESNLGFMQPPPNSFCKFHALELMFTSDPKFFEVSAVQHQIQLEIDMGDERFRKFLVDG